MRFPVFQFKWLFICYKNSYKIPLSRLNQRLTATYESASTRRFRMGRVDCIRSASLDALSWVEAMCQAELDNEGRRVTFSIADVNAHRPSFTALAHHPRFDRFSGEMSAAVWRRRHQADVRNGRQHSRPGNWHPPARAEASRQGAFAQRAGNFQRWGLCENEPLCTVN